MSTKYKSKYLAFLLRHHPEKANLTLDRKGYCSVQAILRVLDINHEELVALVHQNRKQRFEFSPDGTMIRACQGHSIDIEHDFAVRIPPDLLFHGTGRPEWDAIKKSGSIEKRSRHHVHLTADPVIAVQIARRRADPVLLIVDGKKMAAAGYTFFLSINGVWLTDNVPLDFITEHEGLKYLPSE